MKQKIKKLSNEVNAFKFESSDDVENFRIKYLSKKGLINSYFDDFKSVSPKDKKEIGKLLNQLKISAQKKIEGYNSKETNTNNHKKTINDITKPGEIISEGEVKEIQIENIGSFY